MTESTPSDEMLKNFEAMKQLDTMKKMLGQIDGKNKNKNLDPINVLLMLKSSILEGGPQAKSALSASMQMHRAELLQHAVAVGKSDIVKYMLEDLGVDPTDVPTKLDCDINARDNTQLYRQSPFIIQAACSGNFETLKAFSNQEKCDIEARGHIVLSKVRKNTVSSNVLGAAAYYGKGKLLSKVINIVDDKFVNEPATEESDFESKVQYKAEYAGYTPIQLAIIGPEPDLEAVKTLLAHKADYHIKEKSTNNNLLHLAAEKCASAKVFQYLLQNLDIPLTETNKEGQTPLSICIRDKQTKKVNICEEVMAVVDKSGNAAQALLDDLDDDKAREEKARAKRAEKKKRAKLQKLAEKNNCTVDQLEKVFEEQKKQKEQEEKDRQRAAAEAERQEELRIKREQEELQRKYEEEQREYERALKEQQREEAAARAAEKAERAKQMAEAAKKQTKVEEPAAENKLNKKQRKDAEFKARKEQKQNDEEAEETAPAVEETPAATKRDEDPKEIIPGLTGQFAATVGGKRAKKRALDEQKQREEEQAALKERIIAAKAEYEKQKKQREKDEKEQAARQKKQAQIDAEVRAQELAIQQEKERQARLEEELAAKLEAKKKKERERKEAKNKAKNAEKEAADKAEADRLAAEKKAAEEETARLAAEEAARLAAEEAKKAKKSKPAKKPVEEKAVAAPVADPDQDKVITDVKKLQDELAKAKKDAQRAKNELAKQQAALEEQTAENRKLKEEIEEGASAGPKNSLGERQLERQLKAVTKKHNVQVEVNKTLTNKLLIFEKALIDERRKRNEYERRLGSARAQAAEETVDTDYMMGGSAEDIAKLQAHLASVNQRVQTALRN